MSPYEYSPLDGIRHEIRLLKIAPRSLSDDIECNLIHASLDDKPLYEALSYTWGTPDFSNLISLDGKDFLVTKNLQAALRQIRHQDEERVVWIDAICIDQTNIPERNEQVRQMRSIYQSASRVLVWLGPEAGDSNIAMDFIAEMGRIYDPTMRLEDANNVPDFAISDTAWKALSRLFRRPWYKRIWVLQEISASTNATVICGSRSLPWTIFNFVASYIHYRAGRYPGPSLMKDSGYEALWQLSIFVFDRSVSVESRRQNTGILRLLTHFRHCEATDPRDKVYALLGLASDIPNDAEFGPDYSSSVAQVYQELVRFVVMKDQNLDILRACQTSRPEHKLPSWVPDWSMAGSIQCLQSFSSTYPGRASGNSTAVTQFLEGSSILVVEGICADVIVKTESGTTPPTPVNAGIERMTEKIIEKCLDIADKHGPEIRAMLGIKQDGPPVPVDAVRHMDDTFSLNPQPISFFSTRSGLHGTTQASPIEGDLVCVLLGASVPFILRPNNDHYRLIGETKVAALMFGRIMRDVGEGKATVRSFRLG